MHYRRVLLLATVLTALLASCATYKTIRTGEPTPLTLPEGKDALPITGYTTTDGVYHLFEDGTVREEGDSLVFYSPPVKEKGLEVAKPEKSFKLARADVFSLKQIDGTNMLLTTLLVAGVTVVVLFIGAWGAMSSDESMM
jgi:hypothetical protein